MLLFQELLFHRVQRGSQMLTLRVFLPNVPNCEYILVRQHTEAYRRCDVRRRGRRASEDGRT